METKTEMEGLEGRERGMPRKEGRAKGDPETQGDGPGPRAQALGPAAMDALNFESAAFDAGKALEDPRTERMLPQPKCKTFNNLDEYFQKTFGKVVAERRLASLAPTLPPPERKLNWDQVACTSTRIRRDPGNVLTLMKQEIGPQALLHKSLGKRIKVLIRRRKLSPCPGSQFSWLSALLVAFDKHSNLVVYDSDETIQTMVKSSEADVLKVVTHEKHVNKLFVRGDSVVLISLIST